MRLKFTVTYRKYEQVQCAIHNLKQWIQTFNIEKKATKATNKSHNIENIEKRQQKQL
jgi:hypothetical protein